MITAKLNEFLTWLQARLTPEQLPVLTPMPEHVMNVRLDRELLLLHFESAEKPNPDVVRGYIPGAGPNGKKKGKR